MAPRIRNWFGANAPFIGGNQKVLSRQEDEKLIRNDLLQLLLTVPGERYMRPTFGTIIRTSVFDQLDRDQIDAIESDIRNKISLFENRVEVTTIDTARLDNENALFIKIYGFIKPKENFDSDNDLLVELSLPVRAEDI
jgi:phage baseplate assembly protein W